MTANIELLLWHGYTGSPSDLYPIAHAFKANNCHVLTPTLKGHDQSPSDLYHVTAADWLKEANEHLSLLDPKKPIVLGGLSMGAIMALLMASRHHYVKALLLFSPALCLKADALIIINLVNLGLLKCSSLPKLSGSDIADDEARLSCQAYKEMPIYGLIQFDELRKMAIAALKEITCPCFIAFGAKDGSINIDKSHDLLVKHLCVPYFSRYYKNSKHVITLDYDKNVIFKDAWQFLHDYVED